jgi:hypothetical protein
MEIKKTHCTLFLFLGLCLAALISFIFDYIYAYAIGGNLLFYISYYFSEICQHAIPLVSAGILCSVYAKRGYKACFIKAIPYSLIWLIYFIPYYAFLYAYAGFEIGAVLLFTALRALLCAIIYYAINAILLLIIIFVSKKIASRNGIREYKFDDRLSGFEPFNLSLPLSCGFFAAALPLFIYRMVLEIIDIVNFVLDYSGIYTPAEIFYIAFRCIYILALLFGSHWLGCTAKKISR